jgi:hypothetical protein
MNIKKEPLIIDTVMIQSRFWSAFDYPPPEYFQHNLYEIGELSRKLETNDKLLLDRIVGYAVAPCVCYEISSFKHYYNDKRI